MTEERELPAPPEGLSDEVRMLWTKLICRAESPARSTLLANALLSVERLREIRREIRLQGLTIISEKSRMVRVNPLLKEERALLVTVSKLFRQLEIDQDVVLVGDSCIDYSA